MAKKRKLNIFGALCLLELCDTFVVEDTHKNDNNDYHSCNTNIGSNVNQKK